MTDNDLTNIYKLIEEQEQRIYNLSKKYTELSLQVVEVENKLCQILAQLSKQNQPEN